jgi:hypothetical protein
MNTHIMPSKAAPAGMSPEEWQGAHGLGRGISVDSASRLGRRHLQSFIDARAGRRPQIPDETARTSLYRGHRVGLVKVDMELDESSGVNRPGFTLHGGVLASRPDVNCAVHIHTELGMAISGLQGG